MMDRLTQADKCYAATQLVSADARFLSDGRWDFLIWFWADLWQLGSPAWKRYLVDHELFHCGVAVGPQSSRWQRARTGRGLRGREPLPLAEASLEPSFQVTLFRRDHNLMGGEFAECLRRHGVPRDYRIAMHRAFERYTPLERIDGQADLAPPDLQRQLELPSLGAQREVPADPLTQLIPDPELFDG
jgi:hypothetical protein